MVQESLLNVVFARPESTHRRGTAIDCQMLWQ